MRAASRPSCVRLSGNAHVIMPWHLAIDQAGERRLGKLQIGTTRRGIGPDLRGQGVPARDPAPGPVRPEDPPAEDRGRARREERVARARLRRRADRARGARRALRGLRAATAAVPGRHLAAGGAGAARRDARVCSRARTGRCSTSTTGRIRSSPRRRSSPAARCAGIGIGPTRIDKVVGVAKAYVTRVGEGPFPTEIEGPDQDRLRELGGEFGTVTGRERRCGWLDLVALRYAVRLNGITSLALTKLDVLSAFAELPVCAAYELRDGTRVDEFPAHQSDFHAARPVYEMLPGWEEPLDGELAGRRRRALRRVRRARARGRGLVGRHRRRARARPRPLSSSRFRNGARRAVSTQTCRRSAGSVRLSGLGASSRPGWGSSPEVNRAVVGQRPVRVCATSTRGRRDRRTRPE